MCRIAEAYSRKEMGLQAERVRSSLSVKFEANAIIAKFSDTLTK